MKLFRKQKPKNGEEVEELSDVDAAEGAAGQETAEADGDNAPTPEPLLTSNDPLALMKAEAAAEEAAAQEQSEAGTPPSKPDDLLDGGLMDLFREAQSEVQESTLASELPDVSMKDLLSDLVNISQRLGIEPGTGALRRENARDNDSKHSSSRK